MTNGGRNDLQATTRLALIAIPLIGCIIFALLSLLGQLLDFDTWAWLTQIASAFLGTLGLLVGIVTLIFQITRRQLSTRNIIVFGCLYILAVFVFLLSCTTLIETT